MRWKRTDWGIMLGISVAVTAAWAAPPGTTLSEDATVGVGYYHGGAYDPHGHIARHWDLWANYCSEKRREHDPVRHYYPLVRLRDSVLPCHHGYCGDSHCDGCHECTRGVSECHICGSSGSANMKTSAGPGTEESPHSTPQPPVPPVVVAPPATRQQPRAIPTEQRGAVPLSDPIELAPEAPPTVIPPTTNATRVPKNPLPQRRRVSPGPTESNPPSSPIPHDTQQTRDQRIRDFIKTD